MDDQCPQCHQTLQIGDHPFCPHGSILPERAQRFAPIVYFRSPDGKIRLPMRANSRPPKGYEKVELSTRRQVERFEREMNQRERAEHDQIHHEKSQRDLPITRLRQEANDRLRQLSANFTPQGREAVAYLLEKAHRESQSPTPSYDPGFHVEIMHHNQSNRDPWSDRDTGWKDRRE